MRITKRQLKRMIREEKKLLKESVTDMVDVELIIEDAVTELADLFGDLMSDLFDEDPEMFAGRSTREEWDAQIYEAQQKVASYMTDGIYTGIQRVESELHDGQFHPSNRRRR